MSSKKTYNCESCDKTFETATGLWKHKKINIQNRQ